MKGQENWSWKVHWKEEKRGKGITDEEGELGEVEGVVEGVGGVERRGGRRIDKEEGDWVR